MRGAWSHVLFLSNTEEFTSFPLWQASAGRANELGSQKPCGEDPARAEETAPDAGGRAGCRPLRRRVGRQGNPPGGRQGLVEQASSHPGTWASVWPGPGAAGLAARGPRLCSGGARRRARDQGLVCGVSCRCLSGPTFHRGAFSAWADAVRARPGSEGSVRSILSISRRGTCSSWSTVGRWRALHPSPVLEGVARVPVPRSPTPVGREGIFEVMHLHQVSL